MKRKLLVMLSVVMASLTLTISKPAYAAGNIIVDNENPRVGDSLNVKVSSDSGSVTLAFNSNVLQVASVSGQATTSGNTITFSGNAGSVTFKAANTGSSALVLSSNNEKLSSVTLPVAKSKAQEEQEEQAKKAQEQAAQQAQAQAQAAQQQAQAPKTGNTDFTVDGTAYSLSDQFSDSDLPAGFTAATQSIHDQDMKVGQNEKSGMVLVYLKPASDLSQKGSFYIYQSGDDSVSPLHLIGTSQQYVIQQAPDSLFRDDLTEAQVEANDVSYTMYQIPGDTSGLYYVYGTDQTGTTQWFQYDSQSGSVQRVNPALLKAEDKKADSSNSSSSSAKSGSDTKKSPAGLGTLLSRFSSVPRQYLLAGLAAVIVIIVLIIAAVSHRHKKLRDARKKSKSPDTFLQKPDDSEQSEQDESSENSDEIEEATSEPTADGMSASSDVESDTGVTSEEQPLEKSGEDQTTAVPSENQNDTDSDDDFFVFGPGGVQKDSNITEADEDTDEIVLPSSMRSEEEKDSDTENIQTLTSDDENVPVSSADEKEEDTEEDPFAPVSNVTDTVEADHQDPDTSYDNKESQTQDSSVDEANDNDDQNETYSWLTDLDEKQSDDGEPEAEEERPVEMTPDSLTSKESEEEAESEQNDTEQIVQEPETSTGFEQLEKEQEASGQPQSNRSVAEEAEEQPATKQPSSDIVDRLSEKYGSDLIFEHEEDTGDLPNLSADDKKDGKKDDDSSDDAEPEFKMIDLDDLDE